MGQFRIIDDRVVHEAAGGVGIVEIGVPIDSERRGMRVDGYLSVIEMAMAAGLVEAPVDERQGRLVGRAEAWRSAV